MKTKLQIKREKLDLSVIELAGKVYRNRYSRSGSIGHIVLTIKYIETGICRCPKPRKTYEYKDLARVLGCKIEDIMEELQ